MVACCAVRLLDAAVSVRWDTEKEPHPDEVVFPPADSKQDEGFDCAYAIVIGLLIEVLSIGAAMLLWWNA